jgi:short subunit dehydrogenase-like uncharacterized protein
MAGRIVLFGATGYTGHLTAEAMVARGMQPVLAARSADKLDRLAEELGGGLETTTADVADPPSVTALVERGDVLVSTVGPFVKFGHPAAAAASTKGAHYLDSTGEPPFIRSVFERYDPVARGNECGMLTAFGYDFVPGNLAGALALREAGEDAVRVDTGYFFTGATGSGDMSGGTRASLAGVVAEPSFAWRDGRVRTERGARHYRTFEVRGRQRPAVSVGASEHFGLPRVAPLREVNSYLGWFGPASRPMQVMSAGTSLVTKLPGVSGLLKAVTDRVVPQGSTGGPDAEARSRSGSYVVGMAYDAAGRALSEVHLSGVNGYEFTGRMLAWGAERAAAAGLKGVGALGPVDGFGLDELREGCSEAGLDVVRGASAPAKTPERGAPARA